MGKPIRITESKLIDIIRKIISENTVISEVKKVENFDEDYPDYFYTKVAVLPDKFNQNQIGVVFFNGPIFNKSEYEDPERPRTIHFIGDNGKFEFDSRLIHRGSNGIPFVSGRDLNNLYYDKLFPLMVVKTPSQENSGDFTGKEIESALEMAFPDNWVSSSKDYTSGIRGLHTIGERNNTDEDWSIMNYFDTKKEVKELINNKWKEEGSGDKIEWLSSVFKNDEKFLKTLLNKQWNSVKQGFETEKRGLENIISMLESSGVEFEYEAYPPGHKKDRYDAIDLTLNIEGEPTMTIQIKPLSRVEKLPNGHDKVYTYGMTERYKTKQNLGYIMYTKGDSFILFKNRNYYVPFSGKGKEVIHKDKPVMVHNL